MRRGVEMMLVCGSLVCCLIAALLSALVVITMLRPDETAFHPFMPSDHGAALLAFLFLQVPATILGLVLSLIGLGSAERNRVLPWSFAVLMVAGTASFAMLLFGFRRCGGSMTRPTIMTVSFATFDRLKGKGVEARTGVMETGRKSPPRRKGSDHG